MALWSTTLLTLVSFATASKLSNIVYVMTDDQDVELGGLTPMKNVRELLGSQGAVGEAFYIATPICCPSRTETLSGRLYHNVLADDLNGCMHVDSTKYIFNHSSSLFPQLQSAGYITGGFGKVRLHVLAPPHPSARARTHTFKDYSWFRFRIENV